MLADSVEATTRSFADMTPQKLELTIDSVIKKRFLEGQLDECALTLRDLANIREAFIKILVGVHHQRIHYPDQKTEQPPVIEEPVVETEPETPTPTPNVEVKTEQASREPEYPVREGSPVVSPDQPAMPDTQSNTKIPDQSA
jgi:hypothetical protein